MVAALTGPASADIVASTASPGRASARKKNNTVTSTRTGRLMTSRLSTYVVMSAPGWRWRRGRSEVAYPRSSHRQRPSVGEIPLLDLVVDRHVEQDHGLLLPALRRPDEAIGERQRPSLLPQPHAGSLFV